MSSHNLPQQPTAFIGREVELSKIAALLAEPACRLLTLVGPGGIGKTRLAIEVAARRQPHFADGIAFVALAPLLSADFLPAAIGGALEVAFFGAADPLAQIIAYLQDKELLLLIDNFEHLLEGAACLVDLLQGAPRLRILATSRERLNLREEWVFALDGLSYPAESAIESVGDSTFCSLAGSAADYSAVQLFDQLARQAQQHFSLADDLPSVLSICRQVEGMPLGLELAASWLRAMSCAQIAARIASSFDFLTTPLRNMPERHRSLRIVFEKSWSLLSVDEQAALMRLSLFYGGFDLAAAIEVAGATWAMVATLVDKSLVRMDTGGRYDLHEVVRQYAGEKLARAGEVDESIRRHLSYFRTMVESSEGDAYGPAQSFCFDRLEMEMDNLRAALSWSLSHHEIESGLRIASALRWVWEMRGQLAEGFTWFSKLLAASTDASAPLRAKALQRAGEVAGQLAHGLQATQWAREALCLARLGDDPANLAWSLSTVAYFTEPEIAQAVAMLEESLALFRALGDSVGLSHTLRRRAGSAIDQQNYGYATALMEEALALDRRAGDKNTVAWDLCFMGVVLWSHHRNSTEVIPLQQESISLFRSLKDLRGSAHPMLMLAEAEQVQGDLVQSLADYQEILRIERELGIRDNLAISALVGIAAVVTASGRYEEAARLLGAVNAALASDRFNTRVGLLVENFERAVAEARAHLPQAFFDFAWTAGNRLSLDEAITEAAQLELIPNPISAPPPAKTTGQPMIEPLSPREFDVLHLLGDGLSNAAIAQKLVISVATVKVHTRNIYGKLNVDNRAQAILQAQKLNLL